MRTMAKTSLLEFYLDEYLTGYQPGARIVAFRGNRETSSFLMGDGYEVSGLTMYTAAAEAYMEKEELVYRSAMANSPKVVNGIYQISGNTITGMSPVTLEYSLGSDLNIEKLRFEQLSPVFRETPDLGSFRLLREVCIFIISESEIMN